MPAKNVTFLGEKIVWHLDYEDGACCWY